MNESIEAILEKMALEWIREKRRGQLLDGLIADISLMTSHEEKRKKDLDEELAELGLF
jgi:hypothetical protein